MAPDHPNQPARRPLKSFEALTLLCLTSLSVVLGACTQLPTKEFGAYREAFSSARTAGEKVLLDYDATKPKREAVAKAAAAVKAKANPAESNVSRPIWSVKSATKSMELPDAVTVRLQAWQVVADFNDALVALAEGKSADALSASLGELADGLGSFPWDSLGDQAAKIAGSVGGAVGPAVTLIQELAVQFRREQDRQMFIKAVTEAAPLIEGFLGLLRDDLGDFAINRGLLYDFERAETIDQLASKIGEFGSSAANLEAGELAGKGDTVDVIESRQQAEAQVRLLREYAVDGLGAFTATTKNPHDPTGRQKQLDGVLAEIKQLVQTGLAQDREIEAYEALLTSDLTMISKLSQALRELKVAATVAGAEKTLPSTESLKSLVVLVRRAIETYEKAR